MNGKVKNSLSDLSPPRAVYENEQDDLTRYNNFIDIINQHNCQEITITFKPCFEGNSEEVKRGFILNVINTLFKERAFKVKNKVKLTPSIILLYEYGKSGLFHYHGITSDFPVDMLNKFKKVMQSIGRFRMTGIRHFDRYKEYMTKRYHNKEVRETYLEMREDLDIIETIQLKQYYDVREYIN